TGQTHPVPGQQQATTLPPRPPATTQTHHITATATVAQGETLSGSALPSPLSQSKCQGPHIQEEDTTSPPHAAAPPRHPLAWLTGAHFKRVEGFMLDKITTITGQYRDAQGKQPLTHSLTPKGN
ncbi:hypothetical protein CHARACLAT_031386, partial [Characodon lateralis]|nr:hypothetical protein [Characodon lateralis]